MSSSYPKFGKYYNQPWNYDSSQGVGLELIGAPRDPIAFIDLLQEESCNPAATRRILEDLMRDGIRKTTVMAHLNFNYIGDELALLGVTMKIIEPRESEFGLEVDAAAFELSKGKVFDLKEFTDLEKQEINKRVQIAKESFAKLTHHMGPYSPSYDMEALRQRKTKKGAFK